MSYTGPSFSVHLTLHIDPNQLPAFFSALQPFYDAVSAEPECIFAEMYQAPDKPGVFKFVENWNASTEWMMTVQSKKEYYATFGKEAEKFMVKPREMEVWERFPERKWTTVKKGMLE